jgi:hypothetical protein
VTLIQSTVLAADQLHLPIVDTETDPVPPAAAIVWLVADSVYEQGGGAADWLTVNVCPATVKVPLRADPLLAAIENDVVPDPVPDAPPVIEIQFAFDAAVHPQVPAEAVTAVDPEPPASPTLWLVGEMVNVHGGGVPAACETVNVCPAAMMVPPRAAPVFAATLNETLPLPVPDAPAVTVSQDAFDDDVHAQLGADAVTVNEPLPPLSVAFWLAGASEKVHVTGAAAWEMVKVRPAAVIVPERAPPVFAATVNATVPGPVPSAPPVIAIHGASAAAVQAQVGADGVTANEPLPPLSATDCPSGAIA